jgi:ABC-type polysaccharide/polyol phosphate transport system ATPase subunit
MVAVELREVSKKYRRHTTRPLTTTLKSYLLRDLWRKREINEDVTWALKGVDFKLEQGVTLGVIGRNGSGKSTLLKVIGRILKPDAGAVSVNGKVAALIELGAGFHPELTGRENVIINGIILGLSKNEIKTRFDEIVDFAELRKVIDDPVRTYSSGMYVRLGFSVAVHVDPEILLIDEAFAVGDAKFVRKCMDRMNFFKKQGKTIILVSHNLEIVRSWCDEAIWLDAGLLKMKGNPPEVVEAYTKEML